MADRPESVLPAQKLPAVVQQSGAALPPQHLARRLRQPRVAVDRFRSSGRAGPPKESLLDPAEVWFGPARRALPLAGTAAPAGPSPVTTPAVQATHVIQRTVAASEPAIGDAPAPATGAATPAAGLAEEAGAGGAVNLDSLARKVYQILRRRLRVEQERSRGTIAH